LFELLEDKQWASLGELIYPKYIYFSKYFGHGFAPESHQIWNKPAEFNAIFSKNTFCHFCAGNDGNKFGKIPWKFLWKRIRLRWKRGREATWLANETRWRGLLVWSRHLGPFGPPWPVLPLLRRDPLYIGKKPIPKRVDFCEV
jgi:hypothetical protein